MINEVFKTAAVEAAEVAFSIATSAQTSEPVVIHAREYANAQKAVQAALAARQRLVPAMPYAELTVQASYGIHGTHLADNTEIRAADGSHLTVIVLVEAQLPVSPLTLIPVLSTLAREIDQVAAESDSYVANSIFILNEPAR